SACTRPRPARPARFPYTTLFRSLGAGARCLVLALVLAGQYRAAILLIASGVLLFLLGTRWTIKPLSQLVDIVSSLAGTGLGVWQSLRGESYQTWTPVATVRKATE